MSTPPNFVSLHPYFKVHPDKLETFKAMLPEFIARTTTEEGNLYYGFSSNGDEIFCREGYAGAEALLAHLENVDTLLKKALTISEITRLEVHAEAAELEKLKGPLAHLKPTYFKMEGSVER